MMSVVDVFYLSGRKSTSVRGGLMATNVKEYYDQILAWLPVYEGFATYGGMSTKEVEAMAVGLREMIDENVAGASPDLIQYFVESLLENKVPVVTPPGGLACHIDAKRFLPHLPQSQYPAGALAAAIYLASGVRSMERGTISMDRDAQGNEVYADLELARLAVPRRRLHDVARPERRRPPHLASQAQRPRRRAALRRGAESAALLLRTAGTPRQLGHETGEGLRG
jgi:tryptophanase